jgi:hypothetical protein
MRGVLVEAYICDIQARYRPGQEVSILTLVQRFLHLQFQELLYVQISHCLIQFFANLKVDSLHGVKHFLVEGKGNSSVDKTIWSPNLCQRK